MRKTLLLAIPILVILFIATQYDDELDSDSIALFNIVKEPKESLSYIYLLGIYAGSDDDPTEVGRKQLDEYRKLEEDEDYHSIDYPDSKKIPLPEGNLFCNTWADSHCLEAIFKSDFDIDALEQNNKTLIDRLETLHKYDEFQTQTKPSYSEIVAPYHYIARGERLNLLRSIALYKEGKSEDAIGILLSRFSILRRQMELQDNLIGKLIYLMKLSEIVDVASIILSDSSKPIKINLVHNLSLSEKEFSSISAREFASIHDMYLRLDKNPEFWQLEGNCPGWITRMVYKPHMTINAIAPNYTRLIKLSKMEPSQFAIKIEEEDASPLSTSMLRNYIGNTLIRLSSGHENDEFVARFMDFTTKIELFNQIHHYGVSIEKVENPYYEGEYSYIQKNSVCFKGPLEDERNLRCLPLKL